MSGSADLDRKCRALQRGQTPLPMGAMFQPARDETRLANEVSGDLGRKCRARNRPALLDVSIITVIIQPCDHGHVCARRSQ